MTENTRFLPRIGITMGDPAGIGPEVALRLLADSQVREVCTPVLIGDASVAAAVADKLALSVPQCVVPLADWIGGAKLPAGAIVDCGAIRPADFRPGEVSKACGAAAYEYICQSIAAGMGGRLDAVTTGPINKEAISLAGVKHAGHTEIFTTQTGAARSCMMLTSDPITVSFATTHVGYAQVPELLTPQRVGDVIELTAEAMGRIGPKRPKLLVCGLNPHGGEHGLFGSEEVECIEPAIAAAADKGIDVTGPMSPDAAFLDSSLKSYDAIVCMYHDQGHIPFKMLAFDTGVNVTLGLPMVRTSVDHGTAFDIAWQGKASCMSMLHAVRLAAKLAGPGAATEMPNAEQAG